MLSVSFCVAAFEFAALIGTALGTSPDEPGATATTEAVPDGAIVLTARTSSVTTATALDDELLVRVRAVDGVLAATGTFDQPVAFRLLPSEQPERPVALRGVVFSAALEPPWSVVSGRAPVGPDEVAVDVGGAVVGQVAVGEVAELDLPTGRRDVLVVGIAADATTAPGSGDATTPGVSDAHVLFDPGEVAALLGAVGRVDRITVIPDLGVDRDELAQQVEEVVGSGVRVTATSDPNRVAQQTVAQLDDGVRRGTGAFALLTVIVAVIVVTNVYRVALAPRARELALLRLVGASRWQLVRSLLGEALLVGAAGAVAGFGLGVVLGSFAAGLVQTGSAEVGAVVTAEMAVVAVAVGLGVSVLGALAPAWRASAVAPIRALGDIGDGRSRAAGGRLRRRRLLPSVGAAVGAIGTVVARLVPGRPGPVRSMAASSIRRRPVAAAAAASTLIVGLVLVSAVAVAGASVRAGVAAQFEAESTADLYLQRRGVVRVDRDSLVADIVGRRVRIAGAAEVVSVDGMLVSDRGTEDRVVAGTLETIPSVIDLDLRSGAIGGPGSVLLSTEVADGLGLAPGDPVSLRSVSGREVELTVAGTYASTAFYGPAVVDLADAKAAGAEGTFEILAVRYADRGQERTERDLGRAAGQFPRVRVNAPSEFAALNTSVADAVLRIIAVLLGGALGIGAVGLSATLALGVVERTTELSRLRAIGAIRGQVRGLVVAESMLVCAGAATLAIPLGAALGWLGTGVAPDDLITETVIPWRLLAGVGVGSVLLGGLVAIGPANRAARLSPVLAAKQ
jgi:putative ABC transport system permease protein